MVLLYNSLKRPFGRLCGLLFGFSFRPSVEDIRFLMNNRAADLLQSGPRFRVGDYELALAVHIGLTLFYETVKFPLACGAGLFALGHCCFIGKLSLVLIFLGGSFRAG